MKGSTGKNILALSALVLLAFMVARQGLSQKSEGPSGRDPVRNSQETPINKRALPVVPPKATALEFTGPEEGWPPRPKGMTKAVEVPWKEIRGSLTDDLEAQIRRAALQDRRVRDLLGQRFAYVSADEIEAPKDHRPDPSAPLAVRVTFFSHTHNVAVEVRMQGTKVEAARQVEGYQPPEGADEIKEAVALARGDHRVRDVAMDLAGYALLVSPLRGQPGSGHRVLHVVFIKGDEDLPRAMAIVDLTEGKVLSAGH